MSIKQLYQLQEIDSELGSKQRTIAQLTTQLGESEAVVRTKSKLAAGQQHLEQLREQQRSTEWDINDLNTKQKAVEAELYGGKVRNPKELSNLQQEVKALGTQRKQLEDKVLELMDELETDNKNIADIQNELKTLEEEWRSQQKELSTDLKKLKSEAASLQQKREQMVPEIDPGSLSLYEELKRQKGIAVVKVEQGICRGCRLSLSVSELQQVRSGRLARCSSCGRILFLS